MADGDDRRVIPATNMAAVARAIKQLAEMIYKQEGRKGPVTIRDDMNVNGDLFVSGDIHASAPYAILTASADQAFGVGPVSTQVSFDTELDDTANLHNTSDLTKITINKSGIWYVFGNIRYQADTTGTYRLCQIRQNGSQFIGLGATARGSMTVVVDVSVSTIHRFVPDDFIQLYMGHDATNNINVLGSPAGVDAPTFGAIWLAF